MDMGAERQFEQRQQGLSLVELMIALALSSALILGIFTVYLDSSQTSRLSNSLARIQESGRIAINMMAKDLRMVGFQGCADPDDVTLNILAQNPPTNDFFQTTLRGWEVTDSATWADGTELDGDSIESRARLGSDVLAIQRGETAEIEMTGQMTSDNANIQVTGADVGLFTKGDLVLISDCEAADLFRISSQPSSDTWAHANNVNTSNKLSQAYKESARIMRFLGTIYFVADTGRDDDNGNDIFALYRGNRNLANSATPNPLYQVEEIVEGVESLQIEYGERVGANSVRYTTADNVSDMTSVIAVRVGLLVSDPGAVRIDSDGSTYDLPGASVIPASSAGTGDVAHAEDRRLRRVFTSTVMLRNRD
ncbi:PilW family protein [Marinobacter hydrocarbonoclasticus]|nr:PilW family protein [Marinobacter nauticus]